MGSMTTSTRSVRQDHVVEVHDCPVRVGPRVEDPPGPEHVVDQQHAAGTRPRDQLGPVGRVPGLVGVDEDEIEVRLRRQLLQAFRRRADPQLDDVVNARPLPAARVSLIRSAVTSSGGVPCASR